MKHYHGDDADLGLLMGAVESAFEGMEVEAFGAEVMEWLTTASHPVLRRQYLACGFAPMVELLRYLEANGFSTYIASGGDRDFMRPFARRIYGIPPELVIGSALGLDFDDRGDDTRLLYKSKVEFFDDGPTKPVRIWSRVGYRPLVTGGNSNGDIPMMRIARTGGREALRLLVLLDDAEYRARLHETEGRLESAKVAVEKAELDYKRARELVRESVEMKKVEDDARLQLHSARASVHEIEGQIELMKTYLDWTVIKSPINGVVLEKLVDPDELVVPQSFGGTRGPSTALISVADPNDLQVEIELNESDVAKAFLGQKCRVSPEAYPDKVYEGYVAEMAPEANRQKGTLQLKVQIKSPDRFLTPELSAKVDFLNGDKASAQPTGK